MKSAILRRIKEVIALLLVYTLPVVTCPVQASVNPHWQEQQQWKNATPEASPKIPNDQLDSLVAPIALYPDPLLAQILVASTYPLEVIQLQQWLDRNKGLKDKALVDAVEQQNWDPSVQALAPLPDVVKILSENIKWTTDLGNAFLAQQNDVMDAVQRMRMKAKNTGNLKTTEQQTVETKVVEDKTVVVVQPANPDVVYVPTYDPVVVYGAPVYPYPPMYYPPGYYAAGMAISFGVGLAIGYAWGHNNWGYGCQWGSNNNININNNNNFINHNNLKNPNNPNNPNRGANRPGGGGEGTWKHDAQHRGGTPYGNRETANKFGGTARGDSMANRQATARQNIGQMGGRQQAGFGNGGRQQAGLGDGGRGGMDRAGGGMGGDRVGNRDVSRGAGGGAFGGASSGMSGRDARASQSRGASSMGRSGGGGFGGGGGRAGGGGRRR